MALAVFPPRVTALKLYDQLCIGPITDILTSYIKFASLALGSLEREDKCPVEGPPWVALVSIAEGQVTWIFHPKKIAHNGKEAFPKWNNVL